MAPETESFHEIRESMISARCSECGHVVIGTLAVHFTNQHGARSIVISVVSDGELHQLATVQNPDPMNQGKLPVRVH